jgi:putative Mn2+ efflux pump MntP
MSVWEILLLGVGLSMDAFAVSISDGMCLRTVSWKNAAGIASVFGLYQAVMPVLGYLGCSLFYRQIRFLDHWIALVLLCFLGGHMILDALAGGRDPSGHGNRKKACDARGILPFNVLMLQGVATSIDALAVGISIAVVAADIAEAAVLIGSTTFVICLPAVMLGKKSGDVLNDKAQIFGGLILIGIGIKIFVQHMWFS